MWEIQEAPFAGDVINSYNDGLPEPGTDPLGPFYELESSSPATELKSKDSLVHIQLTFHLVGSEEALNPVVQKLLGTDIDAINSAFTKASSAELVGPFCVDPSKGPVLKGFPRKTPGYYLTVTLLEPHLCLVGVG